MSYTDGETKTNAEGAVGMSNMAILLVTRSYLKDTLDPSSKVANELRLLKQYQTPSILIFFADVTKSQKKDAKRLLAGLRVVKELHNAPRGEDFDKWLKANLDPVINEYRGKT